MASLGSLLCSGCSTSRTSYPSTSSFIWAHCHRFSYGIQRLSAFIADTEHCSRFYYPADGHYSCAPGSDHCYSGPAYHDPSSDPAASEYADTSWAWYVCTIPASSARWGELTSWAAHISWGDQSRAITWSHYYLIFLCFTCFLYIRLVNPIFFMFINWDWMYYLNIMHSIFLFRVIHIYISFFIIFPFLITFLSLEHVV